MGSSAEVEYGEVDCGVDRAEAVELGEDPLVQRGGELEKRMGLNLERASVRTASANSEAAARASARLNSAAAVGVHSCDQERSTRHAI